MRNQSVLRNQSALRKWIAAQAEKTPGGEAHGVAVRVLAHRLGVTTAAVYLWAAGTQPPSRKNASRLDRITDGAVPKGGW